ncbi:fibronectin type III domain-containing protein [Cellulomonas sp. PSBB021]|uniref:fibronectin type III domain-containing protein n=1 Tax=Cellulomonas sp. PSBB021 TaxID=2003551 RepID=UPI001E6434AA|nr:fibronectin type III domain-containing protein [Cellulomonas sp. PSBB021]
MLAVSADFATDKGTRGVLQLTIGYGRAGKLDAQIDLRAIASTRPKAKVLDWTVEKAEEGKAETLDVLEGAFNPFAPEPLRVVGATVESGQGTAAATASRVTVTPAEGFIGTLVVRYRVRDVIDEADREVDGRVTLKVRGVPDQPTAPKVVESRDQTVVLSWTAPDSRGAAITGYRLTTKGGLSTTCKSTTCTFDGLTNAQTYTFTVAAQNEVGWSQESAPSGEAVPDAVPDAPTRVDVEAFGDGWLRWSWPAAASRGSSITKYDVQISPTPPSGGATRTSTTTGIKIGGLENGTAYSVRVRAYNDLETPSPWSPSSGPETPAGPPSAPTGLTATRTDTALGEQIDVSWQEPADDNGDDVQGYAVVVSDGGSTRTLDAGTSRSLAFKAQNGVEYTFQVKARNKADWGPLSSPVSAKAYGRPTAPTLAVPTTPPGTGTVRLTWERSDDRGARVTYEIYDDGSKIGTTDGTSFEHTGLAGGSSHTYKVRATNDAGSADSNERTARPTTRPGKASKLDIRVATRGDNNRPESVDLSWDAADSGGAESVTYAWTLTANGGRERRGETKSGSVTGVDISNWVAYSGTRLTLTVTAITRVDSTDLVGDPESISPEFGWGDPPTAPLNVQLSVDPEADKVVATWAPPSSDGGVQLDDYRYCWYVDGKFESCGATKSTSTERWFNNLGLNGSRKYDVKLVVVARNWKGESPEASAEIVVDLSPAPDPTPTP